MTAIVPQIQRILIPVASSSGNLDLLKARWQAPDRDFEAFGGKFYLRLPTHRSNYKPNHVYNNGSPGITRLFNANQFSLRAYIREFELACTDERIHLYRIVRETWKATISSDNTRRTPIEIIDFVLPEDEDDAAARGTGSPAYTTRKGVIKAIKPNGGVVTLRDKGWMSGGWTLTFEETTMRVE